MKFCKCRWVENKPISLKMLNNSPFYILIFDEYVPNVHILSSSENLTKKFVYVLPSDRRVTICLPPGYDNLWIKIALKLIAPTGVRPVPSCVHWLCPVGEYVGGGALICIGNMGMCCSDHHPFQGWLPPISVLLVHSPSPCFSAHSGTTPYKKSESPRPSSTITSLLL